jgi:hypothetical protein
MPDGGTDLRRWREGMAELATNVFVKLGGLAADYQLAARAAETADQELAD